MAKYTVTLPFTGSLSVDVEAESKDAAIDAAFNLVDVTIKDGETSFVDEWETHREVTRGNVFSGVLNEACAVVNDGDGEE